MPSSSSVTPWKPLAWIKVFFLGKLGHSWNISAINFQSHSISMLSHRYLHADRFLWITCTILWSGIDRDRCIVHSILINTRKQRIQPTQNKNSYTIAFRFPLKPLLGWGKRWKHVPIFIRFWHLIKFVLQHPAACLAGYAKYSNASQEFGFPACFQRNISKWSEAPLKSICWILLFSRTFLGALFFFERHPADSWMTWNEHSGTLPNDQVSCWQLNFHVTHQSTTGTWSLAML